MRVRAVSGARSGFTIVELLIVVVVIGILAAIVVVAFSGMQQRARDTDRKRGITTIVKALENYYTINGRYPAGSGSTVINNAWSTDVDNSWDNLKALLVPTYISALPGDPNPTTGATPQASPNRGFAYYANTGSYCGAAAGQMYILIYRLEGQAQQDTHTGDCTVNPLTYGAASEHRVAKH